MDQGILIEFFGGTCHNETVRRHTDGTKAKGPFRVAASAAVLSDQKTTSRPSISRANVLTPANVARNGTILACRPDNDTLGNTQDLKAHNLIITSPLEGVHQFVAWGHVAKGRSAILDHYCRDSRWRASRITEDMNRHLFVFFP